MRMNANHRLGAVVTATLVLGSVSILTTGVWCRIDPAGFAEFTNWPEHEHFLHDAGVFQMGIGLMMAAAIWWRDAVAVVLGGFVFTNTFHAYNHYVDMDSGGNPSDWWNLALVSAIVAVGLVFRLRTLRRRAVAAGNG
ncbi:hypothetical protein [Stackebrandtia nassauensis]|uniref:Uncharacterized protein n=1 Tax=Stackebrandtia nassauensis (strain DSM 44728 / CIP 108903 / NRRL B-16338 / NBRC 102104 / LLR-40K-21) TaxID=446470 RepID=D3PZ01_STANL|nr:hypothetical protein [Stackebrandtia nassauensis]ADD45430.1 hypothetical protein Snas_5800 [Stackebrandtia nassauensis DSM 44728]